MGTNVWEYLYKKLVFQVKETVGTIEKVCALRNQNFQFQVHTFF